MKFAAALLAATATATCSTFKSSQCMDQTYIWYVASGSYAGCMTTLGCMRYIDADKKAEDEARRATLNLGALRQSRTPENCATQYTEGSYYYNQCVKSFGLQNLGALRQSRTPENCATQYTEGSYYYNQCVKSFGLQNLFDFTADIDVDGQYARNCTVNCANRTTYETSSGAVYQNLSGSAAWCSSVIPDTSSKKYLLCTGEYWSLN